MPGKVPFPKLPKSYADQVALLASRGMTIRDKKRAEFYLQHLNYYRLAAYWLPFEANHSTHDFVPNTNFETVLKLYVFDRELRLLILDAIERLEVSVRAQWAYQMAHKYGVHSHLDVNLANNAKHWNDNYGKLLSEIKRSSETFIKHLKSKYNEALPPIWACSEIMSFGLLSRWYDNLKPMPTRTAIASVYGLDENILRSWLQHLAVVRNTCAHHSRLWNREFAITPKIPRTKPKVLAAQLLPNSRKIYNSLVILLYCIDIIAPHHHWRIRLKKLLQKNRKFLPQMGFPRDWRQLPIWSKI